MYRLSPSGLASCFPRRSLQPVSISSKLSRTTLLPKRHRTLRPQPRILSTSNSITTSPGINAPIISEPSLDIMVAEDFESILKRKYPGKAHARRVVEIIGKDEPAIGHSVLYLESRMTKLQEDSDSPEQFRQRRFFYYLTGCNLADCHFAYDVASSTSILFIPPIDPAEVMWSGLPVGPDQALQMYDVDEVKYTTEVNASLARLAHQNPKSSVFALAGQVSDNITFLEFSTKNFDALKPAIELARISKDEYEVACIRKANHISSIAHKAVLERAKSADFENELEAAFLERCLTHNAKVMAYDPILAAGRAAATLHYVKNNAPLRGKQNLLIDAGCEWNNYASDITRTFPLSETFTKESREIYDIVLRMQLECTRLVKAGAVWDDIHLEAHKIAIEGLLSLGILKGKASDIFAARTSTAFFPHGLGHYLGLDTHDVGGKPNYEDPDAFFKYLRLRGRLPAGSVVTVEPGIYFCNYIIEPYIRDPVHKEFIDETILEKYWDVGGIRIEDNVLVTEKGSENLTTAIKESHEIEAFLSDK